MKECVFIDGIRTANARAHNEKGWFRSVRPDEMLSALYKALFERNPKVAPDMVDAVFIGSANPSGMQNDIARLSWLASGLPESVPSQTICNQCPSGMSATMDAARAIIAGEADIMIAGGAEDMEKVPMAANMDFPPRLFQRYNPFEIPMGATAEKVAEVYDISKDDMVKFAIFSNEGAKMARDTGRFKNEIIPVKGLHEDGSEMMVDRDQWIRESTNAEEMKAMKTPFKENGRITAALSSPLTAGAAILLMMSREKADELGLSYIYKYKFGTQAGNDPTVMGVGPIFSVKKLFEKTGLTADDIAAVELNEAFASQALACVRELKLDSDNVPFKKVNTWGGAIAMGHPLGESGARLIVTLLNRMKTDYPDGKYGLASLCGGFGNSNAVVIEKIK
ncbi:MAG TPA: thiolase family protein [Thermodesulfobacteriota bacterium]|nr:thiolase family protein [Thermodesulfobacteriota bacterium]